MNIVWFRQDLRLADNQALTKAAQAGFILPIYILDDVHAVDYKMGAASRVWLHHALMDLNHQLDGNLQVFKGDAEKIIGQLCQHYPIEAVYWHRCYEPWRIQRDKRIKQQLEHSGVSSHSYASLLWEPWQVLKKDSTHYQVFTPYFQRGCLMAQPPKRPLDKPANIAYAQTELSSLSIDELALLPKDKTWHQTMMQDWHATESHASQQLAQFLDNGLNNYKVGRDFSAQRSVTRLSPYLHFGQISPNQIWYALEPFEENPQAFALKRELAWREFSYSLLYHLPSLPQQNIQTKFDRFAWNTDKASPLLKAWQ
jgi:deoxyribodipyrimidine photo-lyase